MTATHPSFQFIGGDDWTIPFAGLGDLTAATIKWAMFGTGSGTLPIIGEGDYTLTITDAAAGTCSIIVAAAKTTTIKGGQYKDALRIISGGVTSTLSMGPIYVTDDPWAVQAQSRKLKIVA